MQRCAPTRQKHADLRCLTKLLIQVNKNQENAFFYFIHFCQSGQNIMSLLIQPIDTPIFFKVLTFFGGDKRGVSPQNLGKLKYLKNLYFGPKLLPDIPHLWGSLNQNMSILDMFWCNMDMFQVCKN